MTEPQSHDCGDILSRVYAFHDHELTDEEADQIREHLMACEPCLERFQVEEALRTLIRKCCGSQAKASPNLRVRVRATFTTAVMTTEAEQGNAPAD